MPIPIRFMIGYFFNLIIKSRYSTFNLSKVLWLKPSLAIKTNILLSGRKLLYNLNSSLSLLFALFRLTAPDIFFETVNPTFFSSAFNAINKMCFEWYRFPWVNILLKSAGLLMISRFDKRYFFTKFLRWVTCHLLLNFFFLSPSGNSKQHVRIWFSFVPWTHVCSLSFYYLAEMFSSWHAL